MAFHPLNPAGSPIPTTGSLTGGNFTDNSSTDHSLANHALSHELVQYLLSFLTPKDQNEAGCVSKKWNANITSVNEHEEKLNLLKIVDLLEKALTDCLPESREALDKLKEIREAAQQLKTEGMQINHFRIHDSNTLKEIELLSNKAIEAWLLKVDNSIKTLHLFLNDDAVMSKFFEKVNPEMYSEPSTLSQQDFVNIIEVKLLYALTRLSSHLEKEANGNQKVADFIKTLEEKKEALIDTKNFGSSMICVVKNFFR